MPKQKQKSGSARQDDPDDERVVLSGLGIASVALAVVCVAAVVLASMIWSSHRDNDNELAYKSRVLQAAYSWAYVLINLNKDTIATSVQQLQEGTVGQLNTELDKVLAPYTRLVQTLGAKTTGKINAAAVESVYHDLDRRPGGPPPREALPAGLASRTDTVLVIATSVSETVGQKPRTLDWYLRIGVSDVGGQLKISSLDRL